MRRGVAPGVVAAGGEVRLRLTSAVRKVEASGEIYDIAAREGSAEVVDGENGVVEIWSGLRGVWNESERRAEVRRLSIVSQLTLPSSLASSSSV